MSPKQSNKLSKVIEVPLSDLALDEDTFQFRVFAADGVRAIQEKKKSYDHVNSLAEELKRVEVLDPIIVWKNEEGKLVVVDGHHRYKAYLKAWKKAKGRRVPVKKLPEGTTKAKARLVSLKTNRKDKLPMTKAQKTQAAWNLISTDSDIRMLSYRKIEEALGGIITYETAGKMKKAALELIDRGELDNYRLWSKVCRRNWDDSDFDAETWEEARIDKLSVAIGAGLKSYGGDDPSIIKRAIEKAIYDVWGHNMELRFDPDDFMDELDDEPEEDLEDKEFY